MKSKIFLNRDRLKLKGNLHTHTTFSDGKYTVPEVVDIYQRNGYDFIAITDHRKYYHGPEIVDSMLVLSGIEVSCLYQGEDPKKEYSYTHFNVIGQHLPISDDQVFYYNEAKDITSILKQFQNENSLIVWNHPLFSRFSEEESLTFSGYDAIEVYNHKDTLDETGNPSAFHLIRNLLKNNLFPMVTATNDFHGKLDTQLDDYYSRAFVEVDVEQKTSSAILSALKQGQFYASNGPKIYDFRIENNTFKIETSPVQHIIFYSHLRHCKNIFKVNRDVVYGEYQLQGNEKYLWIMIVDNNGACAWTQPVYIER